MIFSIFAKSFSVKKIILILIIVLVVVNLYAQGPPPAPTEENVSIVGNLIFLLISGISYGLIKFYLFKKQILIESKENPI
jgi:hypothetical protein